MLWVLLKKSLLMEITLNNTCMEYALLNQLLFLIRIYLGSSSKSCVGIESYHENEELFVKNNCDSILNGIIKNLLTSPFLI